MTNNTYSKDGSPDLDTIPSFSKLQLKDSFIERYSSLLGDKYDDFVKYSTSYLRKCVRINTIKKDVDLIVKNLSSDWKLAPVSWCKEGYFLEGNISEDRYDVGNAREHTLGYIYVQEAASMLPPIVLFQDLENHSRNRVGRISTEDDFKDLKVLDMCASPGSKTTQLAQYMKNVGTLIANDIQISRLKPLSLNMQRCGVKNGILTFMDGNGFKKKNILFDRILVDAPCSGTGTIRRSFKIAQMWSPGLVRKMASIQRKLLKTAISILKPGGVIVYSTCTLEPEENERIVSFALNDFPDMYLEDIDVDIIRSEPIKEWNGETFHPDVKKCLRIHPMDNNSEGFFVARLRKRL